jgi:hypothetical protein
MTRDPGTATRREFVTDVGRFASGAALGIAIPQVPPAAAPRSPSSDGAAPWDLSWLDPLKTATDKAVFDWPSHGDPADSIVLQIASRYLDNCRVVYAGEPYSARVVLNIRTTAVPVALNDQLWARYNLGTEYGIKDHATQQPATRNPYLYRAPSPAPGIVLPTLTDLIEASAIILVCDFALGHLSNRLATKAGRPAAEVHADLRSGFVPGAFAVPSGIFGLARAQNAGCGYVRM